MHEDFYLHVASATLCCTARVSPELIMMARPEELQGETPLHPDQVLVDCVTISWTDTGCTPVLFWYSEVVTITAAMKRFPSPGAPSPSRAGAFVRIDPMVTHGPFACVAGTEGQ